VHLVTRRHFQSRDKDGGHILFDLPYPQTLCCAQTSRLYVL